MSGRHPRCMSASYRCYYCGPMVCPGSHEAHRRIEGRHDEHGDADVIKSPHHEADVLRAAAQGVAHARGEQAHHCAAREHVDGPAK